MPTLRGMQNPREAAMTGIRVTGPPDGHPAALLARQLRAWTRRGAVLVGAGLLLYVLIHLGVGTLVGSP